MSILLDALKKSEAQRQLGETPNLQTPVQSTANTIELRPWLPLLLAVVGFGLVTWLGLRQFTEPDALSVAHTAEREAQVAVNSGSEPGLTSNEPTQGTVTATGAGLNNPAADSSNAGEVTAESSGSNRTPVESFVDAASETEAVPEDPGASRTDFSRSVSEFEAPEPITAPRTQIEDPADSRARLGSVAENTTGESRSDRARSQASTASSDEPQPISFYEMPQSVRDELPELKITVLVYAENPEERFLLMNGSRVVEKDELQPGLVLDEIRREGAVFLFRKYRFLVKS